MKNIRLNTTRWAKRLFFLCSVDYCPAGVRNVIIVRHNSRRAVCWLACFFSVFAMAFCVCSSLACDCIQAWIVSAHCVKDCVTVFVGNLSYFLHCNTFCTVFLLYCQKKVLQNKKYRKTAKKKCYKRP